MAAAPIRRALPSAPRAAGFALVGAIAVLALLVGLTSSVLLLTMSDARASSAAAARARALAAAEAGAVFQLEETRLGRGAAPLAGGFGGCTYTAAPAVPLGGGCWSITCTAVLGAERRVFELFLAEGTDIAEQSFAAVRVQGGGLLTALLPLVGDWRIAGQDTVPPSLSGKGFDDLSEVGNGPRGALAEPALVVHDASQRLILATQLTLLNRAKVDGIDGSGAYATGAAAITVDPGEAIDLRRVTAELRKGAIVVSATTARTQFGSWAQPEVVFLEDGARLGDLSGVGVLVVTGDDLSLGGDLRWEGVVIHYSQNPIDLSLAVGGKVRIFGAQVVQDPNELLLVESALDAHFLYSSQAVAKAVRRIATARLAVVGSRVRL